MPRLAHRFKRENRFGEKRAKDIATGSLFGRLTVVGFAGRNSNGKRVYACRCSCGTDTVVISSRLRNGLTLSCGCLQRERASEFASRPKSVAHCRNLSEAKSRKVIARTCPQCSLDFLGSVGQKFCSKACYRKSRYEAGRDGVGHVGKARKSGAKWEAVSFRSVYERDQGRCGACGGLAPRLLRGTVSELAPTLGHIIPLSRGGDHTYANVQIEHFGCNLRKGCSLPIGLVRLRGNPDPRTREQKISEETRKAMQRPDVRARMLRGIAERPGHPCSLETKERLRLANLGQKRTADQRQRLKDALKLLDCSERSRRGWTPERRKAQSERMTGRVVSEAIRRKISETERGKVIPSDVRKRTGDSVRAVRAVRFWSSKPKREAG